MKIRYLGQSAFLISNDRLVVTDPFNPMLGKLPKELRADIVTVSHQHADHNFTKGVGGNPDIIDKIGENDTESVKIKGVATFHDNEEGKKRGNNIVFIISLDGLKICHLGDLGHVLSDEQIKEIGQIDVLMVPVGGFFTIDAETADRVVEQLKPKIVLPMHYKPKGSLIPLPISGVDKFIDSLGWKVIEVDEFDISRNNLSQFKNKIILFKK